MARPHFFAQMGQIARQHSDDIADGLAAGSTVGFSATLLSDVDVIVSIIAGVLVAISAGLSIYFHVQKWRQDREQRRKK
jgi:hypothetical protein